MKSILEKLRNFIYAVNYFLKKEIRLRDCCYIRGRYRSSFHQICNANYRFTQEIPTIFDNLKGCDST